MSLNGYENASTTFVNSTFQDHDQVPKLTYDILISSIGVVGTTLTEVIEVTVGSHFLAIDWKDPLVSPSLTSFLTRFPAAQ